ncbi:MAG TPA: ion channel [Acidimicrobiales bacterium]|nr:ion channel [Acidimicrobiales bacterium]
MPSTPEATKRPGGGPEGVARRRLLWLSLIRAGLSATLLIVIYYVLPMTGKIDRSAGIGLAVGLLAVAVILALQIRAISSATYPLLRAIEAMATALPLILLLFASTYVLMNRAEAGAFSQSFDRTGALYFTVTVFSTVGFGDIVPKTDAARIATMIQMLVDLAVLGIVARIIVSAVQLGLQRRSDQPSPT